jgi:hypothetical protein
MGKRLLNMGVNILRVGNKKFVSGDMFGHTLEGKIQAILAEEGKQARFTSNGRMIRKKALVRTIISF